jgi:hypothetical protein
MRVGYRAGHELSRRGVCPAERREPGSHVPEAATCHEPYDSWGELPARHVVTRCADDRVSIEELVDLVLVGLVDVDVDDPAVLDAVDVHAPQIQALAVANDRLAKDHRDTIA